MSKKIDIIESSSSNIESGSDDGHHYNFDDKCLIIGIDPQPRGFALCASLHDLEPKKNHAKRMKKARILHLIFIDLGKFNKKEIYNYNKIDHDLELFWSMILLNLQTFNDNQGNQNHYRILKIIINVEEQFMNGTNIRLESLIATKFSLKNFNQMMQKININFSDNLQTYFVRAIAVNSWKSTYELMSPRGSNLGSKWYVKIGWELLNNHVISEEIVNPQLILNSCMNGEKHDLVDCFFISMYFIS